MMMMVMVMMINAEAFTMMELMEMDSLLRIPPPDTFRRLGFGGFLWLGVSGISLLQIWWFPFNMLARKGFTHPGTVTGMVGSHRTMVVKWYRLNVVRWQSPLRLPCRAPHLVRSLVRSGATVPWLVKCSLVGLLTDGCVSTVAGTVIIHRTTAR